MQDSLEVAVENLDSLLTNKALIKLLLLQISTALHPPNMRETTLMLRIIKRLADEESAAQK